MKVAAQNLEPLFADADLKFEYDVVQEPGETAQFMIDKESAVLELPPIQKVEADKLPPQFDLTLEREVEDVFARKGRIRFKIGVTLNGMNEKSNGLVDLDYDAVVKETQDVSRT